MAGRKSNVYFSPERLEYACKAAGMNQKELAIKYAEHYAITARASEVALSRYKKNKTISRDSLETIAGLINADPDYLTGTAKIKPSERDYTQEWKTDPEGYMIPPYGFYHGWGGFDDMLKTIICTQSPEITPDKLKPQKLAPTEESRKALSDLYERFYAELTEYVKKFVLDPVEKKKES